MASEYAARHISLEHTLTWCTCRQRLLSSVPGRVPALLFEARNRVCALMHGENEQSVSCHAHPLVASKKLLHSSAAHAVAVDHVVVRCSPQARHRRCMKFLEAISQASVVEFLLF
jgi:hypothetical protein